ncbi:acyl-CoA dehydrogenase domain-containing protein [Thiofilum flexile]|uniref:acyl-CoA dehydrogenase domain-containing protein n=1 Tax=Thiofilum flexile TaxID=125627 RepID=UPI000378660C|nr:acyl-CoA dehydrogenase domain-containing protein [Thiofilum flexile]
MSRLVSLRQRYFSRPIMHFMRRQLRLTEPELFIHPEPNPDSWDIEVFSSTPNWQRLQAIAFTQLMPHERQFLEETLQQLCEQLCHHATSTFEQLPATLQEQIRQAGCFGLLIPKQQQGLGFSALAYSQVLLKLNSCHQATARAIWRTNSGLSELIQRYGTSEQQARYLPTIAAGQCSTHILLSPQGSTSLYNAITYATLIKLKNQTQLQLHLAPHLLRTLKPRTLVGIVVHLQDPHQLAHQAIGRGLTLLVSPLEALQTPTEQGIVLPLNHLLGGEVFIGQGESMLLNTLTGRGIGLPALEVGMAKYATRYTGAYAKIRQQLGMPLGYHQGIEGLLARIMGNTYLMDAARILTATAFDQGQHPLLISALVKYQLTERLRQVLMDSLDIISGPTQPLPSPYLAQVYEQLPQYLTLGGNNLLLRSLLVFGQGTLQCHPQLLAEIRSALSKDLPQFDQVLMQHLTQITHHLGQSIGAGLTNGILTAPGSPSTRRYYRQLNRLSRHFVLLVDYVVLSLGGNLLNHESLSGRMADIIANLYLCLAALKHYAEQGEPETDKPLMEYACTLAMHRAQQAMLAVFHTLPHPWLTKTLRFVMFPYGKPFSPPDERMIHAVAQLALEPSTTRERVTAGIYLGTDNHPNELTQLDNALEQAMLTAPDFHQLRRLVKQGKLKTQTLHEWIEEASTRHLLPQISIERLRQAQQLMEKMLSP